MTQTQSQLEDLPANDDKFWEHAEVKGNLIPQEVHKGEHFFVRIAGNEAQCNHCDWGFVLDPGDTITGGHLYTIKGKLVI